MSEAKILVSSDQSLCVEFGDEISESINNLVQALVILVEKSAVPGVRELVPTYRSLTVHYDPETISYSQLREELTRLLPQVAEIELPPARVMQVPVLYGGEEYGPDLAHVAKINNLSQQEVIDIHSQPEYLIYMLGFTPGYCYMGGMDERIAAPRLPVPRVHIPAGSVGIAGTQTGIYPIVSPGGWQLIGRTPLKLYDPFRERPILFDAGMRLKFYAIDQAEYDRIAAEQEKGGGE